MTFSEMKERSENKGRSAAAWKHVRERVIYKGATKILLLKNSYFS